MLARARIPNLLTFGRVLAVPLSLLVIFLLPLHSPSALLVIFVVASLTDFLDGYLARKWNAVSPLGTMLDPVADKLLVALMLVYLLSIMGTGLFLPVIVILLREIYVSGLREFLANRQVVLPVSKGGKWKTALQMVAITLLLVSINVKDAQLAMETWTIGAALLYVSAILAITSAISYTRAAVRA